MKGALIVYHNKHFTIMLASVLLCKSKKIYHISSTTVRNDIRDKSWKYPYLSITESVQSHRVKKNKKQANKQRKQKNKIKQK